MTPAATAAAVHEPAEVPSIGPRPTGIPASMSPVTTPMPNPIPKEPPPPKHEAIGRFRDPSSSGCMGSAAIVRSNMTVPPWR